MINCSDQSWTMSEIWIDHGFTKNVSSRYGYPRPTWNISYNSCSLSSGLSLDFSLHFPSFFDFFLISTSRVSLFSCSCWNWSPLNPSLLRLDSIFTSIHQFSHIMLSTAVFTLVSALAASAADIQVNVGANNQVSMVWVRKFIQKGLSSPFA